MYKISICFIRTSFWFFSFQRVQKNIRYRCL